MDSDTTAERDLSLWDGLSDDMGRLAGERPDIFYSPEELEQERREAEEQFLALRKMIARWQDEGPSVIEELRANARRERDQRMAEQPPGPIDPEVRDRLAQMRIAIYRLTADDEELHRLLDAHADGISRDDMAAHLGMSAEQYQRARERMGVAYNLWERMAEKWITGQ